MKSQVPILFFEGYYTVLPSFFSQTGQVRNDLGLAEGISEAIVSEV